MRNIDKILLNKLAKDIEDGRKVTLSLLLTKLKYNKFKIYLTTEELHQLNNELGFYLQDILFDANLVEILKPHELNPPHNGIRFIGIKDETSSCGTMGSHSAEHISKEEFITYISVFAAANLT